MADEKVTKNDSEWRESLTPEAYAVCRQKGTEQPFTGKYDGCKDEGVYRCKCCGLGLFRSTAKYDSGTGWPSFLEPIAADHVKTRSDRSHGAIRTEVLCGGCDAHLGHVFPDGPGSTGERYCMNSLALDLERS